MTEQGTADQGKASPVRRQDKPQASEEKKSDSEQDRPSDAPSAVAVQSPAEAGETQTVEVPADAPYIAGLTGDGLDDQRDPATGQLPPPEMHDPVTGAAQQGDGADGK